MHSGVEVWDHSENLGFKYLFKIEQFFKILKTVEKYL